MLKQHATILRRSMIAFDLLIVAVTFFIGYGLRNSIEPLFPLREYLWVLAILLFVWGWLLFHLGLYSSFRLKSRFDILSIIFSAALFGLGIFGAISYIFKIHISRTFILLIFTLATGCIVAEKMILIQIFRHLRRKGLNFRNILVVGTGQRAQRFIRQINEHREFGLKIVGLVDDVQEKIGEIIEWHRVIGLLDDIPKILKDEAVDHVFFIVPRGWLSRIEKPVLYCETVGVTVNIAIDLFHLKFTHGKEESFMGVPLLTFEPTNQRVGELLLKRLMDIALSFIGLVICLPLCVIVSFLIKLTSKGPIFFRQTRVTLNNRKFSLYKFRTMVEGAEDQLEGLRTQNEMQGPVFKMENDPRLTTLGRMLRKLSIDELPQLWNVLKGEMSLVGPRPPIGDEVQKYDDWQRRRLSMRPGITCFWQIKGRNRIVDFNQWMKLDLEYIDNWSLVLDIKILLQTIPVVLFGVGAK